MSIKTDAPLSGKAGSVTPRTTPSVFQHGQKAPASYRNAAAGGGSRMRPEKILVLLNAPNPGTLGAPAAVNGDLLSTN